jgi:hypothetical protein
MSLVEIRVSSAMFVSKTVFDNSITVLTGVSNPFANWEVNTTYRGLGFNIKIQTRC